VSVLRNKIHRLIHSQVFYVTVIVIFTVLSLIVNIIPETPFIIRIISILIIATFAIIITSIDIKRSTLKIDLDNLLDLMNKSIFGPDDQSYRSNIMIYSPKKNLLEMKYRCSRMKGDLDRNLDIDVNKYPDLCASRAIISKSPIWTNVAHVKGHKELLDNNKVSRSMKSVFSVPIVNKNRIIIGVLNVDSNHTLNRGLTD